MNKKLGFTLAEVLITLGIIGVVAALTAPALIQNVGSAKVGPTLAKVKSTIEIANEQILSDNDANRLSSIIDYKGDSAYDSPKIRYCEILSKYIAGSSFKTSEPVKYVDINPAISHYDDPSIAAGGENSALFYFKDNVEIMFLEYKGGVYPAKGSYKGQLMSVRVDINGFKNKPNCFGKDIFYFYIDESGQMIPWGSKTHVWLKENDSPWCDWSDESSMCSCTENKVGNGWGCSGSIFDNNLKVIYQ